MKDLNFSGKITRFFLYNESLSWLIFIGIIISGTLGYMAMPKQYNPEVTLPAFSIQTEYAGATAHEVETVVTREMEEKMAEIPGVEKISSQSIDGGVSLVRVEFFVGEDLETAKTKVFSQIFENLDAIDGKNISRPLIKNINPDDVSIGVFALTSQTISQNELRQKALSLSHGLQEIKGVANVNISGGEEKALKIILSPQKLKNRNLTLSDIHNAIVANNGRALLGNIKNGSTQHQIEIDSGIINASQAKTIIVSPGIRLGDVAEIEDGFLEKISHTSFYSPETDFSDAIFISLAKQKGVNTQFVMEQAQEKFNTIMSSSFGAGIQGTLVRNNAQIANDAIADLGSSLIQSIIIVSLVLYLFLGARSAFLVAIAIPTTLLFVFFIGYITEQTINKITLFALILSLGLLVDSATVIVENINRHIHEFRKNNDSGVCNTPLPAKNIKNVIILAVNEVGIGLFLSTLTSVIVFLPMTQISGMMGPYMGPLAFFVPLSLILALIIAYMITPFLSYLVFKNNTNTKQISQFSLAPLLARIQKKYAQAMRFILEHSGTQRKILWSAFITLLITFSFILLEWVHFQMLPKSDHKTFWVTVDFPEGTDEPLVYDFSQKLTQHISQKNDEIEHIQIFSGTAPIVDFNGLFRGFSQRESSHQASLLISLKDDRKHSSETHAQQVREMLQTMQKKQVIFRVIENPPGPPVQATFVAKIKGENQEIQNEALLKLQDISQKISGIVDIDSSQQHRYPRTTFRVDSEKAKEKGLVNKDIYDALSLAVSPQKISEFHPKESNEMAFIELQIIPEARDEISDFSQVFLKNNTGEMIPLSAVITKQEEYSRSTLLRDAQSHTEYLTGEMEERSIVYAVRDIIFEIFDSQNGFEVQNFSLYSIDVSLPQSAFPEEIITIEWGGEFEMTLDNFRDLSIAMLVAFLLVYAILVGQFSSFIIPLLIMATVPLAMIGILPGFALLDLFYGISLNATALIGFIALLGIVVNNAIIYLEYLEVLLSKGMKLIDALVQAGEKRLPPIFLTSFTTVLGSLTIASDPVWSGLAWSIVFGLSLSTILTLGIFPILYYRNKKN